MEVKLKAFEYFVFKLKQWYEKAFGIGAFQDNDLSKLKIFKLHFFTSAISATPNNQGLLEVFDEFYALPFGPVESTIYEHLDKLNFFEITNNRLVQRKEIKLQEISDTQYKANIDSAIDKLEHSYFNLIKLNAFELVELSHKWSCWNIVFDYAKSQHRMSSKIPSELIQMESQKILSPLPNHYVF